MTHLVCALSPNIPAADRAMHACLALRGSEFGTGCSVAASRIALLPAAKLEGAARDIAINLAMQHPNDWRVADACRVTTGRAWSAALLFLAIAVCAVLSLRTQHDGHSDTPSAPTRGELLLREARRNRKPPSPCSCCSDDTRRIRY